MAWRDQRRSEGAHRPKLRNLAEPALRALTRDHEVANHQLKARREGSLSRPYAGQRTDEILPDRRSSALLIFGMLHVHRRSKTPSHAPSTPRPTPPCPARRETRGAGRGRPGQDASRQEVGVPRDASVSGASARGRSMSRRTDPTIWMWAQACDLAAQAETLSRQFFHPVRAMSMPAAQ